MHLLQLLCQFFLSRPKNVSASYTWDFTIRYSHDCSLWLESLLPRDLWEVHRFSTYNRTRIDSLSCELEGDWQKSRLAFRSSVNESGAHHEELEAVPSDLQLNAKTYPRKHSQKISDLWCIAGGRQPWQKQLYLEPFRNTLLEGIFSSNHLHSYLAFLVPYALVLKIIGGCANQSLHFSHQADCLKLAQAAIPWRISYNISCIQLVNKIEQTALKLFHYLVHKPFSSFWKDEQLFRCDFLQSYFDRLCLYNILYQISSIENFISVILVPQKLVSMRRHDVGGCHDHLKHLNKLAPLFTLSRLIRYMSHHIGCIHGCFRGAGVYNNFQAWREIVEDFWRAAMVSCGC